MKKTSLNLLYEAFDLISPLNAKQWKTTLFISILSVAVGLLAGLSGNALSILDELLPIILNTNIALLIFTFMGFGLFQMLMNDETRKVFIEYDKKTGENKLEESEQYYVKVVLLYALAVFICLLGNMLLKLISGNNIVVNIILTDVLIAFTYYELYITWELKSFVFNIYQLCLVCHNYTMSQIKNEEDTEIVIEPECEILCDVYTVADYFLSKSAMSHKKLRLLLYYAYSWVLVIFNEDNRISKKLFDESIQAWVHGAMIPKVYEHYKEYGWDDIPKIENFDESQIDAAVLDVLEQVWGVYGGFKTLQLEALHQKEKPWIEARGNAKAWETVETELSDKTIYEYYSSMMENENEE